jgi:hypothetical protein
MRSRALRLVLPALVASGGSLFLAWVGLKTMAFTDYELEAEPAFQALRHGAHVGRFMDLLPAYGGSLVLRGPFAMLPGLWGGGDLTLFRSVTAPCLAAAAVLGVVLYARGLELGRSAVARWLALGLCAFNPVTIRALEIGHPEELLGGALCVGAALAAASRRPLAAGLLLGLAVVNKPWALLAVVPVVALAPAGRVKLLALAGAAVAAVLVPVWLAGSGAVAATGQAAHITGQIFQPWQMWWFFGEHGHVIRGTFTIKPDYRAPPGFADVVARPLVMLVPLALSLWVAPRLRARPWHDGLLLLTVVLLLRCLLDPWNVSYYELPFLFALVAWEFHARAGAPILSLAVTLACWVTLVQFPTQNLNPDLQSAAYLAVALPLVLGLGLRLLAPDRWRRLMALSSSVAARANVPLTVARFRAPTH